MRGTDPYAALFILALSTGLGPEVYLGLQRDCLHQERGIVEVRRTLVRRKGGGWHSGQPKTDRSRRNVAVKRPALRALADHRRRQSEAGLKYGPGHQNHNLVFATPDGSPLSIRNLTSRRYRPALERAKITKRLESGCLSSRTCP